MNLFVYALACVLMLGMIHAKIETISGKAIALVEASMMRTLSTRANMKLSRKKSEN